MPSSACHMAILLTVDFGCDSARAAAEKLRETEQETRNDRRLTRQFAAESRDPDR